MGSGATRTWPPPWPPQGLPPPAGRSRQNRGQNVTMKPMAQSLAPKLLPTSLVLASPFSEWFSSFASASTFSFAFLVFLSSFLSFTAFSFCRDDKTGLIFSASATLGCRIHPDCGSYLCCLLGLLFRLGHDRFL